MTTEPIESYDVSNYFFEMSKLNDKKLRYEWNQAIQVLVEAWKHDKTILVVGNGGNHLNALHFATDWNKGLSERAGKPLKTLVVGENVGLYSAIQNDYPHEEQVEQYLNFSGFKFDIFVLLSAGGTSINILKAAKIARERKIISIGLLGGTSHNNANLFNLSVQVKSDDIQMIEDLHAQFGHTVFKAIVSIA